MSCSGCALRTCHLWQPPWATPLICQLVEGSKSRSIVQERPPERGPPEEPEQCRAGGGSGPLGHLPTTHSPSHPRLVLLALFAPQQACSSRTCRLSRRGSCISPSSGAPFPPRFLGSQSSQGPMRQRVCLHCGWWGDWRRIGAAWNLSRGTGTGVTSPRCCGVCSTISAGPRLFRQPL